MGKTAVLAASLAMAVLAVSGRGYGAEATELPRGTDLLEGRVARLEPARSTFVLVDEAGTRHEVRYSQHTVVFAQDPAARNPTVAAGDRVIVRCSRKVESPPGDPASCPLLLVADRVYLEGALARDFR